MEMTWRKSNGERVKSQANFTVHIDYKACSNCNVFVKCVLSRNSLYSVISRGREANTLGYISVIIIARVILALDFLWRGVIALLGEAV